MATATQRQRQRDKKTQLHPKDKPHTLTHPGYRVTSQKHWKLSWMSHDCKDWSFQDTITGKLALFHSAALPINPFARHCKSWSDQRIRRVNLELENQNQLFSRHCKSRSVQRILWVNLELENQNQLFSLCSSCHPTKTILSKDEFQRKATNKFSGPVVFGPWAQQVPLGPMLLWCVRQP